VTESVSHATFCRQIVSCASFDYDIRSIQVCLLLSGIGSSYGHFCDQYSLHDLLSSVQDDAVHSNLMKLLPASIGDIIVAATSINLDLSVDATNNLRAFLNKRGCRGYCLFSIGQLGSSLG
jgi:hypothetical protein